MAMISDRLHRAPSARALGADSDQGPEGKGPGEPPGRLFIGEGLEISGEISQCSVLKVAGLLRAKVEVDELEVDEQGIFEGEASAQKVNIAGHFKGKLLAESELTVAPGGRIDGEVSYRGLEVEPGGVICGRMNAIDEAADS